MSKLLRASFFLALVPCAAPRAQVAPDPVSAAALRTTLEFLTSDERGGRDSPSRGLDEARAYLVERVSAAGLAPGMGETYEHVYRLPGVRVDAATVACRVQGEGGEPVVLAPDADVRVWVATAGCEQTDEEVARVELGQPGVDRMLAGGRGRLPVLVEVDTDSPLWLACAGVREQLGGRRRGGPPRLLVRKGLLPEGALRATLSVPEPQATEVELRNVVAVLRSEGAREWVVFSAHYDHVGIGSPRGGDFVYNGADDNASGSAAVLALAEAFAAQKPALRRNLAFVWFSAEEKGLRGSRAFVEDAALPLADIAAVVNLEMLGRPPADGQGKAWITGDDLSDLAAIAGPVFGANGVELIDFPMGDRLFDASDNRPFAQKGVVAHSVSAGTLHQDYHAPSDELERLDVDHMSTVVRALYALGVELGSRSERPTYNEKGQKRLGL